MSPETQAELDVWLAVQARAALALAGARIDAWCAAPRQAECLRGVLPAAESGAVDSFHPPLHLPLLVAHALAGAGAGARATAADASVYCGMAGACTLAWAGARLFDELHKGTLLLPWSQLPPAEVVFTAFGAACVIPPALLAEFELPDETARAVQDALARALLAAFAEQPTAAAWGDDVTGGVVGGAGAEGSKQGGLFALACVLPALAAGADSSAVDAWARFGRAFGAARLLASTARDGLPDDGLQRALADHVGIARSALAQAAPDGPARTRIEALLNEPPVQRDRH